MKRLLTGLYASHGLHVMILVILLSMTALTGCAAVERTIGGAPYAEVGVGYQLDAQSHWRLQTERHYQCDSKYQAHFEVGLDWGNAKVGYHHQSWWACGAPFNNDAELFVDDIRVTYTFGG